MNTYKTFNIGFTYEKEDETQFDILIGTEKSEMEELKQLFNNFCNENGIHDAKINYIEEVPYDGGE